MALPNISTEIRAEEETHKDMAHRTTEVQNKNKKVRLQRLMTINPLTSQAKNLLTVQLPMQHRNVHLGVKKLMRLKGQTENSDRMNKILLSKLGKTYKRPNNPADNTGFGDPSRGVSKSDQSSKTIQLQFRNENAEILTLLDKGSVV